MHRTIATIALGITLAAALAGCAATPPTASTTDAAAASSPTAPAATSASASEASASSTPAEQEPQASDATCENLLDAATLAKLEKDGLQPYEPAYSFPGEPSEHFAEYGGILCEYAYPNSDMTVVYGYGPITDAQAAEQTAWLREHAKSSGTNKNGGFYGIIDGEYSASGADRTYVISPRGYWAYSSSSGVDIQEIVPNAPVFY